MPVKIRISCIAVKYAWTFICVLRRSCTQWEQEDMACLSATSLQRERRFTYSLYFLCVNLKLKKKYFSHQKFPICDAICFWSDAHKFDATFHLTINVTSSILGQAKYLWLAKFHGREVTTSFNTKLASFNTKFSKNLLWSRILPLNRYLLWSNAMIDLGSSISIRFGKFVCGKYSEFFTPPKKCNKLSVKWKKS